MPFLTDLYCVSLFSVFCDVYLLMASACYHQRVLPLAVTVYAISVIPLINEIHDCDVQKAWFADDATAVLDC